MTDESKSSSATETTRDGRRVRFWLGLAAAVMLGWFAFNMSWIVCYSDRRVTKTQAIIQCIQSGIALEEANRGSAPTTSAEVITLFVQHPEWANDLRELHAMDQERQCFVDAWGRPLQIQRDPKGGFMIFSAGRDGIPATKDDVH